MAELVSIVVIGRNEENNIARCLESCLAADWENKELIYCDSESTDRTVEIARNYPVRIIVHKNECRNPSIGRNIGLRAAGGDYVYFIDADMVLQREFLKKAFPVLVSHPEIACVIGRRLETRLDNFYVRLIDSGHSDHRSPGEVDYPSGGGGLFRRQAVLGAGGYFERFRASEEPILGQELRKLGYRIILIDTIMAYHDVGAHTLRQYIWFRARQARLLANALILGEKIDLHAYRVAQKHVAEFLILLFWAVAFAFTGSFRLLLASLSAVILFLGLAWKYYRLRGHPMRTLYFVHEFIVGKPLHIIFQMHYLLGMILSRDHPSNHPDGQVVSDTAGPTAG
jgi:glycosyltransferase involved in cell wall biosynthesis